MTSENGIPVPFDPMAFNPRLWEGLPSQTNRYDDTNAGLRKRRDIKPGPLHATEHNDPDADAPILAVPDGWEEYHHPVEGRPYFFNRELRIITEMYIRHTNVLNQLMTWHGDFVVLRSHVLPDATSFDIFLDCSGGNTCRYYMVDHEHKTICWLRQRTTTDLGVSDVRNNLHLRALLNEEYWTHLEYMPKDENHLGAARTELQGALASSMLDHMTSEGSTSPFTTPECKAYMLALDKAAESGHMVYLNWSIARVMGLLVHSRNVNLYGQYGARLDRTATVEGRHHPPRPPSYMQRSALFGGGPEIHLNRIENLWVDRIIYTHHWRALLKDLSDEWIVAAGAAGLMWASNTVFVASGGVGLVPKVICGASGILAGASGVYALYMLREHRALGKYAAHAANYFQAYESHSHGLQELSVKYSLPWAGVMWSFGFTCVGIVLIVTSSALTLAGSYGHVASTLFLVAAVYIYARGVQATLRDLRRIPAHFGLSDPPGTPAHRGVEVPSEPEPYLLIDTPYEVHGRS